MEAVRRIERCASRKGKDSWPSVPVGNSDLEESGGRAGGCGSTKHIGVARADDAPAVLRPAEQVRPPLPDAGDPVHPAQDAGALQRVDGL